MTINKIRIITDVCCQWPDCSSFDKNVHIETVLLHRKFRKEFGNISIDNTRIITMEWINEGFVLIFIGLMVIIVTIISDNSNKMI